MNDDVAIFREVSESPELLRACIDFTSRRTGFRNVLVEKDFVCSAILSYLAARLSSAAVFKGGTCLSKVYTEFYRLSEDLDFTVSAPFKAGRPHRRKQVEPIKEACGQLTESLPGLLEAEPLRGANKSTQYIGMWSYRSIISGSTEYVRIEFSLREPGLLPPETRPAATLVQNAVTGSALIQPFQVNVMALPEIWAEKARAALTRLEPAIRDFFDLDYALLNMDLNLKDETLIDLIRRKLTVPGQGSLNLEEERRSALERQVEGQLRPLLRPRDFDRFDLQRVWSLLITLAGCLKTA